MSRGSILIRVDGSGSEGMGRVARCLALANALQRRRYHMTFVSQLEGNSWPDRIKRFRHAVLKTPHPAGSEEDRAFFLREIQQRNAVMVVTDSAGMNESYLEALSATAPLVIALDESARIRFPNELVLNPTLGKGYDEYRLAPDTQLLAGQKYAMVRAEFRRARNVRATEPGGPRRVMVCLGGGDTSDDSLKYASALLETDIEKIDVIIGSSSKSRDAATELASQSDGRLNFHFDVRDLGPRMTKSHLLITGGGNTALEAGCVGMPMLMVTRRAQHDINARFLEEYGVAQYLGTSERVTAKRVAEAALEVLNDNFERKAMSRSGRVLIDGRGADRIVTASEILLRRAKRRKVFLAAA